jgi:membrane-anchored protein YejM (alkaline phosphatase superfamily)
MKWWVVGACLAAALVAVPVYVHWLRRRPHRLAAGTQHIVLAGMLAQFLLLGAGVLIWWLM